ncbi:hypothetical protein SprV_0702272100 [Sparganum proliferum]
MGENGTNLLQQKVTEPAREQRATRDAAFGNKSHKLPDPTSSRDGAVVHNLLSKELTKEQVQILRHEASFNTDYAKPVSMIAAVESDLAIEIDELIPRRKYNETENRLGHAQIIQLLKFCLRTYFTFDGSVYEQVRGRPISGFIAEAVLQRLESLVFQHHRPKFWARYVGDTFVVIERDQVLTFKKRLNIVSPDMQFTT